MWTVKKLDGKDISKLPTKTQQNEAKAGKIYYRINREGRQLGNFMTLDEIVEYCIIRPTDWSGKNFLRLIGEIDRLGEVDK